MKTKIIYISGSDVFEMADIRAAFDSVRATLGLDNDTVLFGVPVDSDNAIATTQPSEIQINTAQPVPEATTTQSEPIIEPIAPTIAAPVAEIVEAPADDIVEESTGPATDDDAVAVTEEIPVKKSRGRPRKAAPVMESAPAHDNAATIDTDADTEHKVIPILSVLAAKKDDVAPTAETNESVTDEIVTDEIENDIEMSDDDADVEIASDDADVDISDEIEEGDETAETPDEIIDAEIEIDVDSALDIENVEIDDMIADEAPTEEVEKTLEELLESMEPLREDVAPHAAAPKKAASANAAAAQDADATLEQLATEFAANQDKIISSSAAESHGKIGKLKNILPFKKARRDDGGLMGDLFGWAGVAANDDDFAIPGFFTTAASKK